MMKVIDRAKSCYARQAPGRLHTLKLFKKAEICVIPDFSPQPNQ